jgi:hypothetical protein
MNQTCVVELLSNSSLVFLSELKGLAVLYCKRLEEGKSSTFLAPAELIGVPRHVKW